MHLNDIKTPLANGLSTFPIKYNPVFSNGPKGLPNYPPDCPILCNWAFDNFILADKSLAKDLRSLETCVLGNNNLYLWAKLFALLESPITFDEIFKLTLVFPFFFIPYFNLLSFWIRKIHV